MAEIYGIGGVAGAWLLLKLLRKKKSEDEGEDWDALFEKVRHEAGASGKGSDPARRRSISSSEAVELRAKLDAIANAYRVAEQELEAMRASVKSSEAERDRLLNEKDKLASDLREKTRALLKLNAERRAAAEREQEKEDVEPPAPPPAPKQEFEFSPVKQQPPPPPQVQPPWQSAPPPPQQPPAPPQLSGGDPKLLKELDDIRRELEQSIASGSPLPLPYKDMLMRRMAAIQAQLQGQPTVASLPQHAAPPPQAAFPPVPPVPPAAAVPPYAAFPPPAAVPPMVPPSMLAPPALVPPPFGAVPPYGAVPPAMQVPPAMPPAYGGFAPPGMAMGMGMAPPPQGAWPALPVGGLPPYGAAPAAANSLSRASAQEPPKRASQDGGGRARRMSQDEKLELLAKKKVGIIRKKASWGDEFASGA